MHTHRVAARWGRPDASRPEAPASQSADPSLRGTMAFGRDSSRGYNVRASGERPSNRNDESAARVDESRDAAHPGDRDGTVSGSGSQANPCDGRTGGRLNLLLSYAGWQPDPWVDRLPRLLEPMGVTSLTASNGREAGSLIATHRIHVAVVDLALPLDESSMSEHSAEFSEGGPRLLEILARLPQPPPVVAVKRGRTHRDDARELSAALRLGAFAVVDRPHDAASMNTVLDVLRRCLERYHRGCWPGPAQGGSN